VNDLHRGLAPLTRRAFELIDEEARSALKVTLAARKLVDFSGPQGWAFSALGLGRTRSLEEPPQAGVTGALRLVQPMVELRAPFELRRAEVDAIGRGARDAELDPVRLAAKAIARAEDRAVFHGYGAAGIEGIFEAAQGATLPLTPNYEEYPAAVAKALAKLRSAGVDGPYGIALGPRCFTGLTQTTTKAGYPVIQHVQRLLDGPLVWAPAVDGAVVMSLRGGDFELTVGRDFSIGYLTHTAETVSLYIEESFTFRVLASEAAVPLVYGA
jgi:uncharacterized linocin/CFP29 family protein